MLISAWSSDVCSSDLHPICALPPTIYGAVVDRRFESLKDIRRQNTNVAATCAFCGHRGIVDGAFLWLWFALHRWNSRPENIIEHMRCSVCRRRPSLMEATDEAPTVSFGPRDERERSEEHTSELQSLMRISYAVCCLKNTTGNIPQKRHEPTRSINTRNETAQQCTA